MSVIRLRHDLAAELSAHLGAHPERFAFCLADSVETPDGPAWNVRALRLIPDDAVVAGAGGYELHPDALVDVVNEAIRTKRSMIECHSHGGALPRFSPTDRRGLADLVPYMLSSLPGRPYAATVWGDGMAYGEYWTPAGKAVLRSILVGNGPRLRQLISTDDDHVGVAASHTRQLPWFTPAGQRVLERLRIAVVGLGGLGAQVAQLLVYLGVRDFVLVEFDAADATSMNRLVSATAADLETHKGLLARRMIRSIAPEAHVRLLMERLETSESQAALRGVDLVVGAVDNDGARLVLNLLTRAHDIPYVDVAVGITIDRDRVVEAGGRVVLMRPGDPCLLCYGELDLVEARHVLATPSEQERAVDRGYVDGLAIVAPSVVSLNAAVAAAAVNELAVWVSGLRPPVLYQDIDLLGAGRAMPGQWQTPRRLAAPADGCVHCGLAGSGEAAGLDRFARSRLA